MRGARGAPGERGEWRTQRLQKTLAGQAEVSGIGLHTGRRSRVRILPAPPDHGLLLRRTDRRPPVDIPARAAFLVGSERCTALGAGGASVLTVEHLLAALAGLEVDNALVEVEGDEVPGVDGSARPFVEAILGVGLAEQAALRRVRRLMRAVWVADEGRLVMAMPAQQFSVAFAFVSDHPGLEDQYAEFSLDPETFVRELAGARTVAFRTEVEELRRRGLGLGARPDGVVLVGPGGVENPLRYPDEVVRHKILDVVGDLALVGPLSARILAVRSGHRLTHELARRIEQQFARGREVDGHRASAGRAGDMAAGAPPLPVPAGGSGSRAGGGAARGGPEECFHQ